MSDSRDVLARIEREQGQYLEELKEYLRIPSISTDPEYAPEVRRCAEFLAGKLRDAGLSVETIETAGHPLVYAEWLGAPGKPTILFYGHYDVQPPIAVAQPPFDRRGGGLPCRGTTDDKGRRTPRQGGGGDARRARLAAGEQVHREEESRAARRRVRAEMLAGSSAAPVVVSDTSRTCRSRSPTGSRGSPTSRSASMARTATSTPASTAAG